MNNKAMYNLTYGLFILTARDGEKDNGCIVNTVCQVTTEPNRITVCVNKNNYTHDMIMKTGVFNVSMLTEKSQFETYKNWGFQSGRERDKTWDIIADCRTRVYQKTEDGRLRFLGNDHVGDNDENGHPMVDVDDMWIHINGHLVYYDAQQPRETEAGTVFSGDTRARLNGQDEIIIHIEWDPAKEGEDAEVSRIIGYD